MNLIQYTLPWPPSVNNYWRRYKDRYFISAKGQKYRKDIHQLCHEAANVFRADDRLCVTIEAYPPDKRRRDLDNILKSLLDSMQHAGLYDDDSQIDKLSIVRMKELIGQIRVTLSTC